MTRFIFYITAGLLGLIIGAVSALFMAGLLGKPKLDFSDVQIGYWYSDWSIGSNSANPYIRARVARYGILALTKSEAVYFTRSRDDQGRPLREACTYRLSGGTQPAEWWSITLYDERSFLPMNTDQALSIDATSVVNPTAWSVQISPTQPPSTAPKEGWISSRNAGQFDIMLRLYRPSPELTLAPTKHLNPPRLERLSCDPESGGGA